MILDVTNVSSVAIVAKASEYARSIHCDTRLDRKYLVALVPWKNFKDKDEREKARYALGDIGCMGGSGSFNPYIAIVGINAYDSFVVAPMLSSPAVEFEAPVHVIDGMKKVTESELTLTALDWAPDTFTAAHRFRLSYSSE